MNASTPNLTIVRDVGEPLGLYFRLGKNDHTILKQLLSEGRVGTLGAIFDPRFEFQEELRKEILKRNLDAILDTGIMEMATLAGHPPRKYLPWANPHLDILPHFDENKCDKVIEEIAKFVAEKNFNVVLAPSHFLNDGAKDPWFDIDKRLILKLRQRLDSNGCRDVRIYYPLAIPSRIFTDQASRTNLKVSIAGLPIHAIWLRIHRFGSDSTDTKLHGYIQACQDFHGLHIPLVAEKTGVLGLALLAFGAVAGIESGINNGEAFDFTRLSRPQSPNKKFALPSRVYLPDLATFLTLDQAKQFFANRGLRHFACRDTNCCRDGVKSMLGDPRRHFAYTRMGEVDIITNITPSLRPIGYLEQILRPATDHHVRALAQDGMPPAVKKRLEISRLKHYKWQATLGEMSRLIIPSFSAPIERQIRQMRATA